MPARLLPTCSCGLIILISLGIALPAQSGWAVLWLVAAAVILHAAWGHRKAASSTPELPASAPPLVVQPGQHSVTDVEARIAVGQQPAPGKQQPARRQACSACCSKAGWRRCCSGFGSCLAWSSLFWGAVLGLFLVIQSANLAHDQQAFPPPGKLVDVLVSTPARDKGWKAHTAVDWFACGSKGVGSLPMRC